MTTTAIPSNVGKVIRLKTQIQRAKFVRREIRAQGWTVNALAADAELAWTTVDRFAQEVTRLPRLETCIKIFGSLGYDVVFVAKKTSHGTIEV